MYITKEQGLQVKAFLLKKKMTQMELSRLLKMAPQTISGALKGRDTFPKRVYKDLLNALPLNKAEFKKGNFIFKKGVL